MKCPYCGAENADEALRCGECGRNLYEPEKRTEPEEIAEPAEPVEPLEPLAEEPPIEPVETPKKRISAGLIVTIGVAAVALVLMVLILVRQAIPEVPQTGAVATPTGNDAPATETVTPAYPVTAYSSPATMPEEAMDAQIGHFGAESLDNRTLNYYYWGEFNYLYNYYGTALYQWMDLSTPLGQQAYNGQSDYTWQDMLLENSLSTMEETYALLFLAQESGYVLSEEDQAGIDQILEQLRSAAEQYGYADLDGYLQSAYGSGANETSFRSFMEHSVLASNYANQLYNRPEYSEEDIRAYYEAGDYAASGLEQDDQRNIDVRHILIQTRTDESGAEDWAATLAEAERILALWESSPTEEHFAALAEEYTEDPGSQSTGGLYTDVQPGQMVQTFNDWCFKAGRQSGDTGIVQTSYGYHIMYFVAHADRPAWMETVEADMRAEAYSNAVAAAVAQCGFEIDYTAVVLAAPVGMYE